MATGLPDTRIDRSATPAGSAPHPEAWDRRADEGRRAKGSLALAQRRLRSITLSYAPFQRRSHIIKDSSKLTQFSIAIRQPSTSAQVASTQSSGGIEQYIYPAQDEEIAPKPGRRQSQGGHQSQRDHTAS